MEPQTNTTKICILLPVGNSLYVNLKKITEAKNIATLLGTKCTTDIFNELEKNKDTDWRGLIDKLHNTTLPPSNAAALGTDGLQVTFADINLIFLKIQESARSSELTVFNKIIREYQSQDLEVRIILFPTFTFDSYFSAKFLEYHLAKYSCEIFISEFYGLPDVEGFEKSGLPDYLRIISEQAIKYRDDGYTLHFAIAGYIATSVYIGLLAQIMHADCWYPKIDRGTGKSSAKRLPKLPISVNVPRWLQYESLIKTLEGSGTVDQSVYDNLPYMKEMGMLLPLVSEKHTQSGLSKILGVEAKRSIKDSELMLRVKNTPLYKFLGENYGNKFLRLASIAHLIWKGDRVPEMVDHALRHHNNLLIFAERLLLPIFIHKGKDFLKPNELFYLMGALLLHDCGHVISRVTIPSNGQSDEKFYHLYPNEIRDHHNLLGYLRLTEPDKHGGTGKILTDTLIKNDEALEGKPWVADEITAVATLGLYHRKKMLLNGDKSGDKKDNVKNFEELCKYYYKTGFLGFVEEKKPLNSIDNKSLLVALLRIIDSMDEQAARTGTKDDVDFHLSQIVCEAQQELLSAKLYKEGCYEEENDDLLKIDETIRSLIGCFCKKEGIDLEQLEREENGNIVSCSNPFCNSDCNKQTTSIKELHEYKRQQAYIQSMLKYWFKLLQKIPYAEKMDIQEPDVSHKFENGTLSYTITIKSDTSSGDKPPALARKMEDEYKLVEGILKSHNIVFYYQPKHKEKN